MANLPMTTALSCSRLASLLLACAGMVLTASCSRDVIVMPSTASDLGARLSVQAVPASIPRDGTSQSTIVIEALGADGRPARLVVVRIDLLVNGAPAELGTLSSRSVVTGDDGKAQLTYTAPPPSSGTEAVVTVRVTASGGELRSDVSRQVDIRLVSTDTRAVGGGTPPVAAFVVTPTLIVTKAPVTFDASGTTDEGVRCGSACSFAWSFGDGTTGSGETVTHAYNAAASYVVTLTATDGGGASSAASRTVNVTALAKPTADFSYSPASPSAGQDIIFNAEKSTAAAGRRIVSYDWDFGSGRTGTGLTIVKGYNTPGSYVVTLTVTDDGGERAVTDKTVTVVPVPSPTAVLSFSPTTPSTTTTVFFDATPSTAPSPATISSYTFNFGDGTGVGPTTTPSVTHTFAAPGTYVVRLTVTDSLGRTATTTVSVPVINVTPTAVLTFSPLDPKAALTAVIFDGSGSSTPAPATISSYTFNFGDGTVPVTTTAPTNSTTHTFATAATYVVRLTITDTLGRSATTTATVTVKP